MTTSRSTGRHIDLICIAVTVITLVITVLFMMGDKVGLTAAEKVVKYESTIFDASYVHKIDIVMNDWESFIQNCESEEYSPCTVVVDGRKHANIAIRAKGNTSLSQVRSSGSQRYSFKLEFDHYEDGKSLDGLDKLCLNNLIQDNTMMKDFITYQMMAESGVDSPLCSFAYITVNGEDWGLYLAVEGVEESFLSRNYGNETGNLYKPDSMSFGGGRGNGRDFKMDDFKFDEDGNMTMPDNFQMTDGMPDMQQMPDFGSTPPDFSDMQTIGFPGQSSDKNPDRFPDTQSSDNAIGGFPGGGSSDRSSGGFPGAQSSGRSSGRSDGAQSSDRSFGGFPGQSSGKGFGGFPGGGFGGGGPGGMGSSDVKLQYIDDNASSYSNIFNSAKTDVSAADKTRLIASLKKLSEQDDLESVLDMDEVLRYFVVHNFVCNGDSYTGAMIHNYYLHESDGKLAMIPWDYNLAFGTFQGGSASSSVNASIDNPVSGGGMSDRPMLSWIFSDDAYTSRYHELFAAFIDEWYTGGRLEKLISDTADMLRPYVEKDPTKFCSTDDFEKGVAALKQFCALRGEAVSRQLDGDTTAVATDGLNVSDMGTMGMGGGKGGPDFERGEMPDFKDGAFNGLVPPDMSQMPDMPQNSFGNSMQRGGRRPGN